MDYTTLYRNCKKNLPANRACSLMRFCSVDKIFEFPLDLKFTPGDTIVMVKKICRRNFSMYLEHISRFIMFRRFSQKK